MTQKTQKNAKDPKTLKISKYSKYSIVNLYALSSDKFEFINVICDRVFQILSVIAISANKSAYLRV